MQQLDGKNASGGKPQDVRPVVQPIQKSIWYIIKKAN